MKLNARYVSIGDFDDLYFQVSFKNQRPAADYDPSAPTEPYLLLQRQFEDESGVCYLETHDTDRFAGHFRLRLIEFTPARRISEIDRPQHRTLEVRNSRTARTEQRSRPWRRPGCRDCKRHPERAMLALGRELRQQRGGTAMPWMIYNAIRRAGAATPKVA